MPRLPTFLRIAETRWALFAQAATSSSMHPARRSGSISQMAGRVNPAHFDDDLAKHLREYLDTKTMEGYLAGTQMVANIAWRIGIEIRSFVRDSTSEARKFLVIGFGKILGAEVGQAVLKIAGLLPKEFHWIQSLVEFVLKTPLV